MKLYLTFLPLVLGIGLLMICVINFLFSPQVIRSKLVFLFLLGLSLICVSPFLPVLSRFIWRHNSPEIIQRIGARNLNGEQAAKLASYSSQIAVPKFFYGGVVQSNCFSQLSDILPELNQRNDPDDVLIWASNAKVESITVKTSVAYLISDRQIEGFDFVIVSQFDNFEKVMTQVINQSEFFTSDTNANN